MNFNAFDLNQTILANVYALGYTTPTPIQNQSIPSILLGNDVMGLAQTGTGKTAAFVLPILQRLMQGPRSCVRALIIAPTRELAQQIHDAIGMLAKNTKLRSVTLYGGVNITPQIKSLKQGVEIVVACPGRLLDHLQQRTIDLAKVEVLVLDEADQMFDMGFLPDIRRILRNLPKKRQTLLFSATMPDAIHELAHDVLRNPVTVKIGQSAPPSSVKQMLFPVPQQLKTDLLIYLLNKTNKESVLVFTRTKHTAKKVALKLEKAGFSATSLQGNLSQNKRQSAMSGFRDGTLQILVATDIASRGIDVTSISHVINYDIPNTVEAYIHRIGRTGRAAKEGEAFTLITQEDHAMLRAIERVLGRKIEQCKFTDFDYTATPAPQTRNLMSVATKRPTQHKRRR
ncbi:MAG: RNA helicase [Gammaproteobacteria bacterium RIFCSPHIGHO2_12_FULL_45_9]|nr:MAG: RNA helicase [Gammaproteobacteria bacterium RIFCSPHIGHO2_12_FULL_45_9]